MGSRGDRRLVGGEAISYVVGDASRSRFFAAIFDHSVALMLTICLVVVVPAEYVVIKWTLFATTYVAYFLVFEALWSRTPGKLLQGLVIRKLDGSRCGWKAALIRFASRIVEVNPLLCGAIPAGIMILATKRRQRIGDLLAGTLVVSDKIRWEAPEQEASATLMEEPEGTQSLEACDIWLGQFGPDAPEDYFEERYEDDDGWISQFAREQGEKRYDHDFVEISFVDDMESVRSFVAGHSYHDTYLEAVVERAAALNIERINVFVLAGKNQFQRPRSASGPGYRLEYLGKFPCHG